MELRPGFIVPKFQAGINRDMVAHMRPLHKPTEVVGATTSGHAILL